MSGNPPGRDRYPSAHGFLGAALLIFAIPGAVSLWREGLTELRSGAAPVCWLPIAWAGTEVAILARQLTLEWDRYFLGVAVWGTLLACLGAAATLRRIRRGLILEPPKSNAEPTT